MKYIRSKKNTRCCWCVTFTVFFSLSLIPLKCYSADLIFIRSVEDSLTEQREINIASDFYGLNLKTFVRSSNSADTIINIAVGRSETLGVAITAKSLALVNKDAFRKALSRKHGGGVPVLVVGVTPEINESLLDTWSGGAGTTCRRSAAADRPRYVIGHSNEVTRELADLELPFPGSDAFYFALGQNNKIQELTKIQSDRGIFPTFIETAVEQLKVFLACAMPSPRQTSAEVKDDPTVRAFTEVAPAMMFTKYCAGERGWHPLHHYANFTIDDPWLREPYGYLHYRRLLNEMESHNFHSTIAFIPWNYDRSESEVVSLLRDNPTRFSIAIHGDNHDHKEFTDYGSKPLALQIHAIKQSLARMERFRLLTGIPYDRVMIFPHSIAPQETLEALKTYNFWGTVNSSNVPMDCTVPSRLSFPMRPATDFFASFASIKRYSVEVPIPNGLIGVNAFLENPLFFYGHHNMFAKGSDSFDPIADQVNQMDPNIRWRSVGDIVRHLYLVRLRDDRAYDVLAFSNIFSLESIAGQDSIFYVSKQEPGRPAIKSVKVDGQSWPHQARDGHLDLKIPVAADTTRSVAIEYENDLELASIDTSKTSVPAYFLRMASDFRDTVMSRYSVGRTLTGFYYKHKETTVRLLLWVVLVTASFSCGVWALFRKIRKASITNSPATST
jgi:hypothetical protein